jgi:hypothetical protein
MSAPVEPARWQPFGTGRMAPAGSLADAALLGRLRAYKREVAGAYRRANVRSPMDRIGFSCDYCFQ